MSAIQNPYNNVGSDLPPQPFGSVVDHIKKVEAKNKQLELFND